MSDVLSLLPLAVGVAVFGGLIGFLISRDIAAGKWLFAALLLGHAWVHMVFVMPRSPGDTDRSWLTTSVGVDPGAIRGVAVALVVVTMVGYLLASLSTVGLIVPVAWWPTLILIGTVASVVALAVFATPTFYIGFAVDGILLWIVLASIWSPAASVGAASP